MPRSGSLFGIGGRILRGAALLALCASVPLGAEAATQGFRNDFLFLATAVSDPRIIHFDLDQAGPFAPDTNLGVGTEPVSISYDPTAFTSIIANAFGSTSDPHSLGTDTEDQAFVGGDQIELRFPQVTGPIDAVGLYLVTDEEALDPSFFTLSTSSGASASSSAAPLRSISDGSVFFVGVVDEGGFESVTLTSSSIDDLVFNIDDIVLMERAQLPEPGANVGLAVALLSLGGLKRLRRRARVA